LSNAVSTPSVHEGNRCWCLSKIPDKYQQVLSTQSESYADIPSALLPTVSLYNHYVVSRFSFVFFLSSSTNILGFFVIVLCKNICRIL